MVYVGHIGAHWGILRYIGVYKGHIWDVVGVGVGVTAARGVQVHVLTRPARAVLEERSGTWTIVRCYRFTLSVVTC